MDTEWQEYNSIGSRVLSTWRIRDENNRTIARMESIDDGDWQRAKLAANAPTMHHALEQIAELVKTGDLVGIKQWAALGLLKMRQRD